MRSLVLYLCLLNPLASCAAAATLSGTIFDPAHQPVPKASVSLFSRDDMQPMRTLSDSAGAYRFEELAAGNYLLEVQTPGFARYSARQVRVGTDQPATLDVTLQLAARQDAVVVTASATPQSIEQVSKSISVVDSQALEERDVHSIAEAVRLVPGLRVQQLGGPGSFTTIKMRGLRNEDTGILIDGFRFRDPTSPQGDASGYLEDLLVTDVDRVEVLRGSGSALYGTNAIGGVINIVTSEGGGPLRGSILLEGGGLGLFRGRAQMSGGGLGGRLQYSAGATHLNVTRGVDDNHPARTSSGQGYVSYRLTPNARLSARLYGADSFLRLDTDASAIGNLPALGIISARPGFTFAPAQADPDSSRSGRFVSGAVQLSGRASGAIGYNISYQGSNENALFPNGPAGAGYQPRIHSDRENDGTTHILNGRMSAQLGAFQLLDVGYEFEREHYVNRNFPDPATRSVADVGEDSHALYVQDQFQLMHGALQFSGAFRTQWFALAQPLFTPSASAPYRGSDFPSPPMAYTGDASAAYSFRKSGTKIRSHAGRGYRAPSLYERFGTYYSSYGYGVYGDPALRPNRSIGMDGGIDQSFGHGRARASATYFYTRLQEVIGFGSLRPGDPFGRFSGYTNLGGGLARGVETSLSAAPTRSLDLTAAYTFTNSRQRTPIVTGVTRSLVVPDHDFSLVATQHISPRFFVNAEFTTTSNYLALLFDQNFASHAFRFEGMRKVGLGASYRVGVGEGKSLRFFGKADNVLNQTYYENGFRTPGVFATGGLQFGF